MSYQFVLTTVASLKDARALASKILRHKLAACVTVSSPVESHYEWKGKLCREKEYQLFIKTRGALYASLESFIRKHHTYDVPEIIALPIVKGSSNYLSWLSAQTRQKGMKRSGLKGAKAKQQ